MKVDLALLFLRLTSGGMMLLAHGQKKLLNFSDTLARFPDPIGVGPTVGLSLTVFAEVFCAAAIILGLKTRFATIPLIITMLVALFLVHANDPWNKQEFVILYLIPYITLLISGGGRFAVDHLTLKA